MQCLACLVFTSNSENEDFREMAVARAKKVWLLNDLINETITRLGIERDALASRCHALEEILGDVTMKVKGEAAHISTWVANVEALQRERDQAVAANNILSKQIERLEELLCHVIEVAREEIHGRDRIDDNEYE